MVPKVSAAVANLKHALLAGCTCVWAKAAVLTWVYSMRAEVSLAVRSVGLGLLNEGCSESCCGGSVAAEKSWAAVLVSSALGLSKRNTSGCGGGASQGSEGVVGYCPGFTAPGGKFPRGEVWAWLVIARENGTRGTDRKL